mgnify:CR=1 FL=1
MIGDPTGAISRNFDVMIEEEGLALRGSFIINPDGIIKTAEINDYLSNFNHPKFKETIDWLHNSGIKIIEIDKMIKFNSLEAYDIFTSSYKKKINNLLK